MNEENINLPSLENSNLPSLESSNISLIQSNIESMDKILDDNKFTPNEKLFEELERFKTQIEKIDFHRPNIDINYYNLFKQNYPNELRWDIPSSKSSLLPIPKEQIDIKSYLNEFSKIIEELRNESEIKLKEFHANNSTMVRTIDSFVGKNDKSVLINKVNTLKDIIHEIEKKNDVFVKLFEFKPEKKINNNLFIDPECVTIDMIPLTNIYVVENKLTYNSKINEFLTILNETTEPSLERKTGLNIYELLINPNLEYLLKPIDLSKLSSPDIKNTNESIFPQFKLSLKELTTNIYDKTSDSYNNIKKELMNKELEFNKKLLKEQIESLKNNVKMLINKIEEAKKNNRDKEEFIDIIINSKNEVYIKIFTNFIEDKSNIFNKYDKFIKELLNLDLNISDLNKLKKINKDYDNIQNEYLEIEKLIDNYQVKYNNFLQALKSNKYFSIFENLELFKTINIDKEFDNIDCKNLRPITNLDNSKILELINNVRINMINNNKDYFESKEFQNNYGEINTIKSNIELCKKKNEERLNTINLYKKKISDFERKRNLIESLKDVEIVNDYLIKNSLDVFNNYIKNDDEIKNISIDDLNTFISELKSFNINGVKEELNTEKISLVKAIYNKVNEVFLKLKNTDSTKYNKINSSLVRKNEEQKFGLIATNIGFNLENIKEYNELKKINETLNKLSSQTGGESITKNIEKIYINLINNNLSINNLKIVFANFIEVAKQFNINYIHVYNHLLFIMNYLKSINTSKPLVYKYLGLGTVTYYMRILDRIKQDIQAKNELGKYFYKYHYLTINIVYDFLNFLNKNWKPYNKKCNESEQNNQSIESKRVITKLDLFGDKIIYEFRKPIFLFNAFKDILDKYYLKFAPPVGIYLRINDWKEIEEKNKVFDVSKELGYISNTQLNNCINSNVNINNISSKVKFQEVFDPKSFGSNDILSKYMAIPTFLGTGRSIMLITYGYSGVGKTFTIFGTPTSAGVLQSSLNSIENKLKIYCRTYEIYGLAFPYKSYWERDPDSYYHEIIEYTFMEKKVNSYKNENIKNYINKILISNDDQIIKADSTFKELTNDELKNFSNIVSNVDKIRVKNGTIKRTVNNRESSRSIMVYDFKIKIGENKYVNFVVMDLPGKENIFETFALQRDNVINKTGRNSVLEKYDLEERLNVQYDCISPIDTYGLNKEMFMTMAYLNPMSLMTIPKLHEKLISNKEIYDLIKDPKFIFSINGQNIMLNKEAPEKKIKILDHFKDVIGLEIMRNIIILNRFDLLEKFYSIIFNTIEDNDSAYDFIANNKNKKEKYKCSNKKYSLAPFEGYYINENIIGLLNTLLTNLGLNDNKDFVTEQPKIYSSNKELKNLYTNFTMPDDETICQTYFFRYFMKNLNIGNNYGYSKKSSYESKDSYIKNIPDEFSGNPLAYWLKNTYDYNKAFKTTDPPIATFLKPYFEVINNFYVFYVVSNMNKEKCEKQIKLISDSEEFLKRLGNFDPIKYNEIKGNKINS